MSDNMDNSDDNIKALSDYIDAFDFFGIPTFDEYNFEEQQTSKLFFEGIEYEDWNSNKVIEIINKIQFLLEKSNISKEKKEYYFYKIKIGYHKKKTYFQQKDYVESLKMIYIEITTSLTDEIINEQINQFENQDDLVRYKKIDEPEILSKYVIFEINQLQNRETILNFIRNLPQDILKDVVENGILEEKIPNIYNSNDRLDEKIRIIKKEILLLDMGLSNTTCSYIRKHNIDLQKFLYSEETHIFSEIEINEVVKKYGIMDDKRSTNISIAKIIGYDGFLESNQRNIIISLSNYFDTSAYADGYHSRSNGMLKFKTGEEALEKLTPSFKGQPICVGEFEKDKYVITSNGLHRYTILRILYLQELFSGKNKEELELKYMIPVQFRPVNFFKTYCNFLLQITTNNIKYIYRQYDENYKYTNNVEIYYADDKKEIVDDQQLLNMVSTQIVIMQEPALSIVNNLYQSSQSFKEFIDKYFPTLIDKKGAVTNARI